MCDSIDLVSLTRPNDIATHKPQYTFAGEEDASSDEGEGEICDAQAVSINSALEFGLQAFWGGGRMAAILACLRLLTHPTRTLI